MKRLASTTRLCMSVSAAFLFFSGLLHAGNTGKIAGVIKDKQTGELLLGVNVKVSGTKLGAASDIEGRYFILQVLPGIYDLEVSSVGHHPIRIKDVKVQVDLTTTINIQLESRVIEAPIVEVTAERKMVQKDVTSTRRTVTRENMLETPAIESTNDIFKLQGGAFVSSAPQTLQLADGTQLQVRDESLKDIHVRGGRGGELLYVVDGVPVTHPIYGGRSVLELNLVDVEQVELLTGAFNAEYGQAQSGVVNITTRSGSEKFTGGIEYKADRLKFLGESYETDYASLYLGGREPLSHYILPELGVNLPGSLFYFISINGGLSNTTYNNRRNREDFSVLGIRINERQDNSGNVNGKLNWDLPGDLRLTMSYQGSWKSWSDFDWLWKNFPNNTASFGRNTHNLTMQASHFLSKSTFYNLSLGYLSVDYRGSLYNQTPADYWTITKSANGSRDSIYSTVAAPALDPLTGFYDNKGFQTIYRDDLSRIYTFKGDITSQVHPEHLIKSGLELKLNDIRYVDIQDGGTKLSNYGEWLYRGRYIDTTSLPPAIPPGPFKEFGQNRWVFLVKPLIGSWYIQDKFELEMLIINAGLRMDFVDIGKTVMDAQWKKQWEAATGKAANWKRFRFKVSPRFGISFPISERTVTFFSYGHFVQLPELQYYYRDPYSGGFTGNPKLDFEQTILYEFGFTHQLADFWAIDVKSYAKDVSKYVGTTRLRAALGLPVELYDNNGYARARGLEFMLTKAYSDFTSGTLTYT
ncbi:MAG: TonB-dependent receptor, partial [Ignavibacteriae bacterium]|nr:TonB-dependent receptor [Ignavibacteriota bacterium]